MFTSPTKLPVVGRRPIATANPVSARLGRHQRSEGTIDALRIEPTFICRLRHSRTPARLESVWEEARNRISAAPTVRVTWSRAASVGGMWTARRSSEVGGTPSMVGSHAPGTITSKKNFWPADRFLIISIFIAYKKHSIKTLQGHACDLRINRRGQWDAPFGGTMSGHAECRTASTSFMFARAHSGARRQA